jgi:putative transposase
LVQWLFEAKKRYGLIILNYTVTSNIYTSWCLMKKGKNVIPQSIKLIDGRTPKSTIRERKGKGHSGKTVIMRQRLSPKNICFSASLH